MFQIQRCVLVTMIVTMTGVPTSLQADTDKALAVLKQKGVRISSLGASLASETELSRALTEVQKMRRTVFVASRKLAANRREEAAIRKEITRLIQLNVQLNARLSTLQPNDVVGNNRLVGAINGNNGKMALLRQTSDKLKEARGELEKPRESYLQKVLELGELADTIENQYATLPNDPEVKSSLEQYNKATGKSITLKPSRRFRSLLKRSKALEDTVLSESISLRRSGNTFRVPVMFGSKKTEELVVDSGASLISLPAKMASELGVKVQSSDPEIVLQLADGSKINGRLVEIPQVRVGSFTEKNVKAVVLDPEATAAPALLGMSFLGRFKFELNAQSNELTLVRMDEVTNRSR